MNVTFICLTKSRKVFAAKIEKVCMYLALLKEILDVWMENFLLNRFQGIKRDIDIKVGYFFKKRILMCCKFLPLQILQNDISILLHNQNNICFKMP